MSKFYFPAQKTIWMSKERKFQGKVFLAILSRQKNYTCKLDRDKQLLYMELTIFQDQLPWHQPIPKHLPKHAKKLHVN